MRPEMQDAFVGAVSSTFDSLFESPTLVNQDAGSGKTLEGIVASISFTGDCTAVFQLCLPVDTSVGLVEQFIGMPIEYADDDMADAVSELVNIIAGDVTVNLSNLDCNVKMGLPSVVRGALQFPSSAQSTAATVPMHTGDSEFEVRIVMKDEE